MAATAPGIDVDQRHRRVRGAHALAWLAYISGTTGTEEVTAVCRTGLGGYKIPGRIEFSTELPRNVMEKVHKRELRARHAVVKEVS